MLKAFCYFGVLTSLCLMSVGCNSSSNNSSYTDISGNSGQFSDHQGSWFVINYWAIWCKPCIHEIPELNDFARNNAADVTLFSVNYDNTQGETLIEQSKKLGIEFPTLTSDPAQLLGYERPKVLPTTVIFDKTGKLHKTLIGPQTEQSLKEALSL